MSQYKAYCPVCGWHDLIVIGYVLVSWKPEFYTEDGLPDYNEDCNEEQHDSFLLEENPYKCMRCDSEFQKPNVLELENGERCPLYYMPIEKE